MEFLVAPLESVSPKSQNQLCWIVSQPMHPHPEDYRYVGVEGVDDYEQDHDTKFNMDATLIVHI